jgi:enoyl-CoA hydratase
MASSTLTGLIATSTPVEHVKVIAFNRPEKRNALSQALIDELLQELSAASKDDNIHAIVITGNQSFFSGKSVCACHSSLILLST